jgi:hypothetical protein
MKTKITVTRFEHEELVNILSTALFDSSWFGAGYDRAVYESLAEKNGDCFEDILADMLLAGHKITITDYEADGESYSDKCVGINEDDESAEYEIGIEDFLKVASTEEGYKLVQEVLSDEGDYYTADAFLQRVVFGKEIYG